MSSKSRVSPKVPFVSLSASAKPAPAGTKVRRVDPRKILTISVQLPTAKSQKELNQLEIAIFTGRRQPPTNAELVTWFGARPKQLKTVLRAIRKAGLTVLPRTEADEIHGIIQINGSYAKLREFFPGLELFNYVDEKGKKFIGREGTINVKSDLPLVGVFGFDNREHAETNFEIITDTPAADALASQLTARGHSLAQGVPASAMDNVPTFASGYISLGGDNGHQMWSDVLKSALHDNVTIKNTLVGVSVDGTPIEGDYTDQATVENILDANAHALQNPNGVCVCFRSGNTDDAFARAIEYIITYKSVTLPDGTVVPFRAVTISWGMAASNFTVQSEQRWARAAQALRMAGMIVTSAAGDNGSKDNTQAATPDTPSNIPGIIGAGGVVASYSGGKASYTTWSSTGGGIDALFPQLPEEANLNLPNSKSTGKPGHCSNLLADISMNVYLTYNGRFMGVGGTSNSAPVSGAKLALIFEPVKNRPTDVVGFIYAHAKEGIFQQVSKAGSNGDYPTSPTDLINVPNGFGVIKFVEFAALAKKVLDGGSSLEETKSGKGKSSDKKGSSKKSGKSKK